jgi:hypothetical protein
VALPVEEEDGVIPHAGHQLREVLPLCRSPASARRWPATAARVDAPPAGTTADRSPNSRFRNFSMVSPLALAGRRSGPSLAYSG